MRNIAIYGAGGLGKEIACLIRVINESNPTWTLIGFFDDNLNAGEKISHYGEILGGIDELNRWEEELDVVLAVGDSHTKFKMFRKITNPNISFPNVICPDLWFADENSVSMGKGNIIRGGSAFSCDVSIGDFNLFNGTVTLGHDVRIGSFNTFMPAVHISGGVTIEAKNTFGTMSFVLQCLKIGTGVTLSPGSILLHTPKDNSLYIGNPAKIFKY